MESLLSATENQGIVNRIEKLSALTQPLWGKMRVEQMLAHCQVALRVASGEQKLKRNFIGFLVGGFAKKKLLEEKPFDKNMPTAPDFKVKDERNFDKEKATLLELVKQFTKNGEAGITKEPHPFFGKMNTQEWDTLQWKHLDHHLRQFGV